jgi:DNA-binding response OmpR family regulator
MAANDRLGHHVLLVEPYGDLSDLFRELLTEAGCSVDVVTTGAGMEAAIAANHYDCVLLNIDQNRTLDFGLDLATIAAAEGSRIIMIPDHKIDRKTIAAKGWVQLTKPFTGDDLREALVRAMGPAGEEVAIAGRVDEVAAGVDEKNPSN